MVYILGLDPGLRCTGWGIIQSNNSQISFIASGFISPDPALSLPEKLSELYKKLSQTISQYPINEVSVEETFVNKNPASSLKLGMARGVIILAPALVNLKIFEYSANQVKKAVVGAGHADKIQITRMIKILLPKAPTINKVDEADALAISLCHAFSRKIILSTKQIYKSEDSIKNSK